MANKEKKPTKIVPRPVPKKAKPPPKSKEDTKKKKEKKTRAIEGVIDSLPAIDPKLPREEQITLALRRIANAAAASERVDGELTKVRHEWAELCAKRRVSLKAAIESEQGTAQERMNRVRSAHQKNEEAEAGRKLALADMLEKKKKIRKMLSEAFLVADQMELDFGDHPKRRLMGKPDQTPEQMAAEDDAKLESAEPAND